MQAHLRQAVLILAAALAASPARGLTIQFDYAYDTSGFFSDPARRATLNQAATYFGSFTDSLSALAPGGGNSWDAAFLDPSTGSPVTLHDPTVPANTLTIYVGARHLPAGTLADSHPGSAIAAGDASWLSAVATRGQVGATDDPATSTDFGPWGGSASFDAAANWYFGPLGSTVPAGSLDFLTYATHELAHVLGFGTAPSFQRYVVGNTFTGPASVLRYTFTNSSTVPLAPDRNHWADETLVALSDIVVPAMMRPVPTLTTFGSPFSPLDYAGMKDLGWRAPILPATLGPGGGDTNGDRVVDLTDLNNVLNNFGTHGSSIGDVNGDQRVDLVDLNAVLNHYGWNGGVADGYSAMAATVPEPVAVAFLLPLAAFIVRRRSFGETARPVSCSTPDVGTP